MKRWLFGLFALLGAPLFAQESAPVIPLHPGQQTSATAR